VLAHKRALMVGPLQHDELALVVGKAVAGALGVG